MSRFRRIALTVEQDGAGQFHWLILESLVGIAVYDEEVKHGAETHANYEEAWKDGLEAIKRHFSGELEDGPKAVEDGGIDNPVETSAPSESQVVWSPS